MKFINWLFITCLIFGISSSVLAKPFSFGLESGVDISNLDKAVTVDTVAQSLGFQTTGFTTTTGFTGGLFGEWEFIQDFSAKMEFFYSMKGTQIKSTTPSGYAQTISEFDYFEIPLLARYQLPFNWAIKPSIFVGPSFAILTGVNQTFNQSGAPSYSSNSSSGFSSTEWSVTGGLEADWENWLLNIRYTQGLTQMNTMPASSGSVYIGAHNITFSILAGYRIW